MLAVAVLFVAKVLSIAGIGGLLSGLFIRPLTAALAVSGGLAVVDTVILLELSPVRVTALTWVLALLAALLMCGLGRLVRRRFTGRRAEP